MTDKFSITPLDKLLQIILNQYNSSKRIFGIYEELFFIPKKTDPFRLRRFNKLLETPIGVAAGPHSQLAQNIVAAWLCGARYIELKTVQTLDELDVAKPCIDMQDEGYNCEWSQELKIKQSFEQYLDAWIIIHVLRHFFGWGHQEEPGVIFNMSVGYNLDGILNENVQWFFNKMADASIELAKKVKLLKGIYPAIEQIKINSCISDNITLSTMHGCPPDEIEKIGTYLLKDKGLHTTIKLNPTLLGKEKLQKIISNSGFETQVPDIAFEHDLKYPDAIRIIKNLRQLAKEKNLDFGLKLTNTLESRNHKDIFPADQEMMYMSGKALHPIAICVAEKLQTEFEGELDISFSAGVDAFNISKVISCGLSPATVCSDILKPGGYARLNQYFEELNKAFENSKAKSSDDFFIDVSQSKNEIKKAALKNLQKYAVEVLLSERYKRKGLKAPSIKTKTTLGAFDCIHAPCETTCPTHQGVPDYMYYAANGDFNKANGVIRNTNPFPLTTGMVCDHICQSKCTRINYDSSLLIRDIKRSVAENADEKTHGLDKKYARNNKKVAIIGAGPSGLSCAYFLRKSGFKVIIYETNPEAGGMVSSAIPKFRLTDKAVEIEIKDILDLGVEIIYNQQIDKQLFESLKSSQDFIYIACGAQKSRSFFIDGMEAEGVLDPLQFLYDTKAGKSTGIGRTVLIIGGGNTAMDAARTAKRLIGKNGKVILLYRRTLKQMPANYEEIKAVQQEGIEILELVNPLIINQIEGKVSSLVCERMQLGEKDASGRAKPEKIESSEFEIACDTIIPAVGQDLALDFIDEQYLKTKTDGFETLLPNIFIGGDALNGGLSAIAAIGDGRKVAQLIIDKSGIDYSTKLASNRDKSPHKDLMIKKARRIKPVGVHELPINQRDNFNLITSTLSKEETIQEASRCLLCDELCNICTTVCPNLALFSYEISPFFAEYKNADFKFEISQSPQILHIADWCNQCGNCNTFCPTSGAPYMEKPHLHLSRESFETDTEGYFLVSSASESTLLYKTETALHSLTESSSNFTYFNDLVELQLNKQSYEPEGIIRENNFTLDAWQKAVEMSVILKGAKAFFGATIY